MCKLLSLFLAVGVSFSSRVIAGQINVWIAPCNSNGAGILWDNFGDRMKMFQIEMAAALAIRTKKTVLRAAIKKRLQSLTTAEKAVQSQYVTGKLLSHPKYLRSRRISIYLSTDLEISTLPILEDIFKTGKTCFVPRYEKGSGHMEMVHLRSMEDLHSLPLDSWNIRIPTGSDREDAMKTGGVDLAVVPCVGMTTKGDRLGHGKGYYDLFLTQAKATTIAPVFREQIEEDIPTEKHDVKIDYVLFMPFS